MAWSWPRAAARSPVVYQALATYADVGQKDTDLAVVNLAEPAAPLLGDAAGVGPPGLGDALGTGYLSSKRTARWRSRLVTLKKKPFLVR